MKAKIPAVMAFVGVLSACNTTGEALKEEKPLPTPSSAKVVELAKRAYRYDRGSEPVRLKIESSHVKAPFGDSNDLMYCYSTEEKREGPIYTYDWKLLHKAGSKYREKYAMLVRYYDDDGWGVGVSRVVSPNTKIGFVKLEELCGPSAF